MSRVKEIHMTHSHSAFTVSLAEAASLHCGSEVKVMLMNVAISAAHQA